jgi:transcription elongation factor GreA
MDKNPITAEGLERLKKELKRLTAVERPAIIRAIAEAREMGDLSENAEYHAARERQSFVEGQVTELEDSIRRAEVIDVSKLSGKRIQFGATVRIEDADSGDRKTYQIVGADEADVENGRLSIIAPLARALIGKSTGDLVEISTPGGVKEYEVIKVSYK